MSASSPSGLSLSFLQEELGELQKDRDAFARSYDILKSRVGDSLIAQRSQPPLHKWSGARACLGSLEMALLIIERNVEEHTDAIHLIRTGQVENTDVGKPVRLGVIEGGDGE